MRLSMKLTLSLKDVSMILSFIENRNNLNLAHCMHLDRKVQIGILATKTASTQINNFSMQWIHAGGHIDMGR